MELPTVSRTLEEEMVSVVMLLCSLESQFKMDSEDSEDGDQQWRGRGVRSWQHKGDHSAANQASQGVGVGFQGRPHFSHQQSCQESFSNDNTAANYPRG